MTAALVLHAAPELRVAAPEVIAWAHQSIATACALLGPDDQLITRGRPGLETTAAGWATARGARAIMMSPRTRAQADRQLLGLAQGRAVLGADVGLLILSTDHDDPRVAALVIEAGIPLLRVTFPAVLAVADLRRILRLPESDAAA